LGREIAIQLAQGWSQQGVQSDLVLIARTEKDLKTTKTNIERASPGTIAHVVAADLQDLASVRQVFAECMKAADETKHQQFVMVHCAGTAGDITRPMSEQTDPSALQEQMGVNFTSMSVLTSLFLSRFPSGERLLVNITSLMAKVFLPGFSMYSATRAARNALFGVLAAENPTVRFLTYSPGPCMTDMFQSIADTSHSESVRELFSGQMSRGEVLTCAQSVSHLVQLLRENRFENAAVIDYYDKV
jgi:sepiapterin reductase